MSEQESNAKWRKMPGGGRKFEFQADLEPVTAHVASQYHAANGGASFYVHGGTMPNKGYAIGGLPGVPEKTIHSPVMSPEQFQQNRDRIRAARPNDMSAVAGSWVSDGKSVLDGSNTTPERDVAKTLQIKRGEQAVYNLNEQREEDLR